MGNGINGNIQGKIPVSIDGPEAEGDQGEDHIRDGRRELYCFAYCDPNLDNNLIYDLLEPIRVHSFESVDA